MIIDHRSLAVRVRIIVEGNVVHTHLVVTNVVVALVHALPIGSMHKRVCDVLEIWDAIDKGTNRPASVSQGYFVQIN